MNEMKYTNIPIRIKTKKELLRKKLNKQAELGKTITWDEFLLGEVDKGQPPPNKLGGLKRRYQGNG